MKFFEGTDARKHFKAWLNNEIQNLQKFMVNDSELFSESFAVDDTTNPAEVWRIELRVQKDKVLPEILEKQFEHNLMIFCPGTFSSFTDWVVYLDEIVNRNVEEVQ